jgi:hypothetical protein
MGDDAFGACAPSAWQQRVIAASNRLQARNRWNKWLASLYWRLLGPDRKTRGFDWIVFGSQRVRLYPGDNLTEKRVLMTPGYWDLEEREVLHAALRALQADRPFVFVDVGANAGMYSLFMQSRAWLERRPIRILAVEPAPGVLERLRFNVDAAGAADIEVLPWAATERREEVTLFLNAATGVRPACSASGRPFRSRGTRCGRSWSAPQALRSTR